MRNLVKRYGAHTILDGINLEIPPGEIVCLIGPSGGGKSTLLRCLNGLNTFDQGQIHVGPHELRPPCGDPPTLAAIRRNLGMIFQDFQLFPHLTAVQNVMEAPRRVLNVSPADARARALALLEEVGLAERAHHLPSQLSGGQKQRVAIARALAMNPVGLLCDEITSALDPELKVEVLEVLEKLRAQGITILMVTHEIFFARRAADRVVVLAGGKIVESGPPAQVIDRPETERTRKFLGCVMS